MTQYRIAVRQLVADEALSDPDDRRKSPKGTYFCEAESKDRALDHFHANVAIGCLDEFEVIAALVNEPPAERKRRRK